MSASEYSSELNDVSSPKTNGSREQNFYRRVLLEYKNYGVSSLLLFFIALSMIFLYTRLQHMPGLGFLGSISAPSIVGLIAGGLYLPYAQRNIAWPLKAILVFMVFQGLRGVLGYTVDPNDLIIRNDFHHFYAWKTLAIDFFALSLPVSAAALSKRAFSYISKCASCCGVFLSFWGLTHAGRGPGGVVGDENDLCFFILTCIPFGVLEFKSSEKIYSKLFFAFSLFSHVLGVVSTNSRGGMLGFIAIALFYLLLSPNKFKIIIFAIVSIFVSIPFLPEEFKSEFTSIQKDVSGNEGTVKGRKQYWQVAWAVFTEPRHIPFGVGLRNVNWWIPVYERQVLPDARRSRGGRSVHSMYFELLTDLGLFGIYLIGGSIFWSIRSNHRSKNYFKEAFSRLSRIKNSVTMSDELRAARGVLLRQANYLENANLALNACFAGALVSGVAISVLYYPPIWFLIASSVALKYYSKKIVAQNEEFFELLEENSHT